MIENTALLSRPKLVDATSREYVAESFEVEVLAKACGFSMVRVAGFAPFAVPDDHLSPIEPHHERKIKAAEIDVANLRERYRLDPETGLIYARQRCGHFMPGALLGSVGQRGYSLICMGDRRIVAHAIAWALHHGAWPTMPIDHINGVKTDNRPANLRLATAGQNGRNKGLKPPSRNTSGYLGVSRSHGRWKAVITISGRQTNLGHFDTPEEASDAYLAARSDIAGHTFVRGFE